MKYLFAQRRRCGLVKLSEVESKGLQKLLAEVIRPDALKYVRTHLVEHEIDVQDHSLIKHRHYRVFLVLLEAMYDEVDNLLADNFIESSNSEWSSPVMMLKKTGAGYRMCIYYRKVNDGSKCYA